ncbi:hypothetical protein EV663_103190 [Rhodovulum bhavnagarense]|uniref:Uncharacterized protein n=1 Tax=Rhodovulum bhavnagarense TaxID=992286 RepID=A0A4R2RER4_9RHOB|nr:hypothetical protein [Rhodovulum bhavnagarense]TCP62002.1 hypothetical protein EV663_103190 [Rhodovulum bhavnagarense]
MSDEQDVVLVSPAAAKWIGLVGGLLVPLFLAVVASQIYMPRGETSVQVFPLPDE